MNDLIRQAVFVLALAWGIAPACALYAADDSSDPAVEAAREALGNGWFGAPWYDSDADNLRRIPLKPERESNWDISWLFDWIPNLFSWLGVITFWEWLAWIIVVAIVATLVYILIRLYLSSESNTARRSKSAVTEQKTMTARIEALPFEVDEEVTDMLAAATACRKRGDYNRAIVYLFSHLLIELDRFHRIALTRGKTNRQYLRELKRQPRLRQILQRTMVPFEEVFFGSRTLAVERFDRCWEQLDEFGDLVKQGGVT
jgi:hypothetical protein